MSFIDVTTLLNLISPQCNVKRCFLALDSLNSWVNIRLPKIQQSEPGEHLVVELTVHPFLTNTLYQLYYMFYPIYTCIYIHMISICTYVDHNVITTVYSPYIQHKPTTFASVLGQ